MATLPFLLIRKELVQVTGEIMSTTPYGDSFRNNVVKEIELSQHDLICVEANFKLFLSFLMSAGIPGFRERKKTRLHAYSVSC